MRLKLNSLTLPMLIDDLGGFGLEGFESLKIRTYDGDYQVALSREQVKRLKRNLEVIKIEERYR